MRTKIERVEDEQNEEVVIRCHRVTPEIEAVARQLEQLGRKPVTPAFFKGDRQYYLSLSEVLFFETDAERVFAHTADDAFETRMRLYELEAVLPGSFVRVSRSAIVNARHIFSIQKGLTRVSLIAFRNSHKIIYCSRMYTTALLKKMEVRF